MRNLDEIEDRSKLLNGGDSVAVSVVKAKKPIELLICSWKLLVCLIVSHAMPKIVQITDNCTKSYPQSAEGRAHAST